MSLIKEATFLGEELRDAAKFADERHASMLHRAARALDQSVLPIPPILTCPLCGARHVDAGEYTTKVHHTHSCQECGHTWRPAVVPTVGVQYLPGFKDKPNEQLVDLVEKTSGDVREIVARVERLMERTERLGADPDLVVRVVKLEEALHDDVRRAVKLEEVMAVVACRIELLEKVIFPQTDETPGEIPTTDETPA